MKLVKLTRGLKTKIDNADFRRVSQHKWLAVGPKGKCYAARFVGGIKNRRIVYLHKFLLKITGRKRAGYKNGDRLDNRRSNLRFL